MGLATAQAKLTPLRPSLPLAAGALSKFESLALQDFFYLYSRANLFANGYTNKKSSVCDTFKLWKCPRGER